MRKAWLIFFISGVLSAQYPQIPLSGNIGAQGVFPLINSPAVVFTTDANHTMTYPEMSGSSGFIKVTCSGSLSTTRNLIAPLAVGFNWTIENTCNEPIQIIGTTGTGVTIAAGAVLAVACDGTNYITAAQVSGFLTSVGVQTANGVSGTSSGGSNPLLTLSLGAITPTLVSLSNSTTGNGIMLGSFYQPGATGSTVDIATGINTTNQAIFGYAIALGNKGLILDEVSGSGSYTTFDSAGNWMMPGTLTVGGHLNLAATGTPSLAACTGGSVVAGGTDQAFHITGLSGLTACTATFSSALHSGVCTANGNVVGPSIGVNASTSAVTFSFQDNLPDLTTTDIYAICF